MDPSEALTLPGVKAYVNSDDLPGDNITGDGNDEEVFATDKVNGSVAQKQKKLQAIFTRKQFQYASLGWQRSILVPRTFHLLVSGLIY